MNFLIASIGSYSIKYIQYTQYMAYIITAYRTEETTMEYPPSPTPHFAKVTPYEIQ